MPSTVYKGDLAEVTFGHETGLVLTHGAFGGLTFSVSTGTSATATITITDYSELNTGDKVNLVATDSTNYNFTNGDQSSVNGTWEAATSNDATASNLMNVINTSSGPAGTRFTATVDGAVITVTQATAGNGNTTVTLTDSGTAGMSKTDFTGGSSGDTSNITFGGSTTGFFSTSSFLRYPEGLLAGSRLRVLGAGNYTSDDYSKGHVYTIVDNYGSVLKVTPAMQSTGASTTGDQLVIESLGTPTIDVGMTYSASAAASDETVLTDQFVGLAATVNLPETVLAIKRSHVVGIGRDIVVQEPQSMKNEGGTLETMMHSARWLYYALGNEAISNVAPTGYVEVDDGTNTAAIGMGDTFISLTRAGTGASSGTNPAVGDYITVTDTTEVLTPYSDEPTSRTKWGTTGNETQFHSSVRSEIRRVVAVDTTASAALVYRIYVDDPFNFDHALGFVVNKITLAADNATGSPNFQTTDAAWGNIQNRQKRALWSMWHQPSFTLETSMRSRDVDSYGTGGYTGAQANNAPGGANDSKQLTRLYKGCKVKDWELTADQDAEVKMSVNFDALMCYTDTGRLEASNAGDRYTAHRMFENTGNSLIARKAAGISPNTEKPFFFYNGTITAFGQAIAQVTKFSIKGDNGLQQYFTVGAMPLAEARNATTGNSLEQIPFGGSRNPTLVAEGKVEYEATMEIIVSDPLLYHEFRTNRAKLYGEPITLHLVKNGAGDDREEIYLIIDDYILEEAPLQIPDDKTPIKSELKIKPKHIKATAYDAMLHC